MGLWECEQIWNIFIRGLVSSAIFVHKGHDQCFVFVEFLLPLGKKKGMQFNSCKAFLWEKCIKVVRFWESHLFSFNFFLNNKFKFPYLDNMFQQVAKIWQDFYNFLLSSMNCSQILANSSCGWLPMWLDQGPCGALWRPVQCGCHFTTTIDGPAQFTRTLYLPIPLPYHVRNKVEIIL
jgi:hypothetical protein